MLSRRALLHQVGRSAANLSHLRCNRSKSIRFSLLEELCRELRYQPGDLLVYEPASREEQD
ncbi:helix-turn-helix domain-containing protein [Adlercreutzia rubneri]